jgi:hypothetical protein
MGNLYIIGFDDKIGKVLTHILVFILKLCYQIFAIWLHQ